MTALNGNYTGINAQNGYQGAPGHTGQDGYAGFYALNIGGTPLGYGKHFPSGTYASFGQILGGAGGTGGVGGVSDEQFVYNDGGNGGIGGVGVELYGGTLTNHGLIVGGHGGNGGSGGGGIPGTDGAYPGGDGGIGGAGSTGVVLAGAVLINQGNIVGGYGGNSGDSGYSGGLGGAGGMGVDVISGTLTNHNNITGGRGGTGGTSDQFTTLQGGNGGVGGAGIEVSSGKVTNSGNVSGSYGGHGGNADSHPNKYPLHPGYGTGGTGGAGGAGIDLSLGSVTNTGYVVGGNGGDAGNGGYGPLYTDGFSVYSVGGAGGNGGTGGAGIYIQAGTLTNSGQIWGGTGGSGGYGGPGGPTDNVSIGGTGGDGGYGGAGVSLHGGVLTNTGQGEIKGGTGGYRGIGGYGHTATGGTGVIGADGVAGNGGAGAFMDGGTLITSGTISGGADGSGLATGDAVQFGTVASTLVVEPGAVFNGQVAGNGVNDTLKLSGIQAGGTPITLGDQFTGFATLTFASGAAWTVDAGSGATPSGGLTINAFKASDAIDITNLMSSQVAADFNPTTHVLSSSGDGTMNFSGAFSGEYFMFSSDGGTGTDITLAAGSGISTTVDSTVTVGSAAHPSPLTITATGVVVPTVNGATGVVSSVSTNSLTNGGRIQGGAGLKQSGVGGSGGLGVNLKAGTLTNTGSITGGAGGQGSTTGGHGGTGVELNGGTLITSGTISGGIGGSGITAGASGDAVQFGAAAGTLIVDPDAVFNGQVVGNASAHDVLELSGTQAGGSAITLGTQFTNFSMLEFAPGATGTVDATVSDLTKHPLNLQGSIAGFGLGDTLDITNLVHAGTTSSFDATTEILTITKGATVIQLGFDSPFTGDHFVLASNGHGGTDVTLQTGAASEPVVLHGFSSHAFANHDVAHDAHVMMS